VKYKILHQYCYGERDENPPGSIVVASMEGTRPILVELQALTSRNNFWFSKKNCKWNRLQ